jgi:hypothetical protein
MNLYKDIARTFSYAIDLDCFAFEIKSVVASYLILESNEILLTSKASLNKIDFHFWTPSACTVIFQKTSPMHFYLGRWFLEVTEI